MTDRFASKAVRCPRPRCRAKPGEDCVNTSDPLRRRMPGVVHWERAELYRESRRTGVPKEYAR